MQIGAILRRKTKQNQKFIKFRTQLIASDGELIAILKIFLFSKLTSVLLTSKERWLFYQRKENSEPYPIREWKNGRSELMLEMEALGFIRALSATPVFLNAEGRRHQLAVSPQLGSIAPWAAVSGGTVEEDASVTGSSGNWILNIMRFGSLRKVRDKKETDDIERKPTLGSEREELDGDGAEGCSVDETEDRVEFDCDSFSRLLVRVSMAETEFYAKMAYLCNLAYSIPKIEVTVIFLFLCIS